MKRDAHFYALLAMARSVGIEKETAHKIAYAIILWLKGGQDGKNIRWVS